MPQSVSSAPRQLSDGNSAGTLLGQSTTDLIGFYGDATPQAQTSGAAQTALTRGLSGGLVATLGTTATPVSTPIQQTNESTLSLYQQLSNAGTGFSFSLLSNDAVVVNKPTQQSGIGIGTARYVNATQIAVGFANLTSATVTATIGEKYGIVAIRGLPYTTQTWTPASVAASTSAEQLVTVPGMRVGEAVIVNPPSLVTNIIIAGTRIAGPNQVGVTFMNASTTTATTPPGGTYQFFSLGGIDMANNTIAIQTINPTLPGPAGSTTASFSYTVTGLLTSDQVVGIEKPTQQAGIAFTGAFVTGANTLGISYTNFGPTVTPTASEVYGLTIYRTSGVTAPCVLYTPTLSPASVPPNTTMSQAFTVTGLVNSSVVVVNKPTAQPGLGILGVRVSGTNQLEICYGNATAVTLTPTPGEVYTVANLQQNVPDPGSAWILQVTPQQQQMAILDNAIRNALVGMGLIAGA